MKLLFTYIILLFSIFLHAQVKEDYQYFLDKATGKIYQNPESGLKFTQNLMMNDKNADPIFYQHIVAQSYALRGDNINSAKAVFNADSNSNFQKEEFHQVFFEFCLADQYQNLGLYEQSSKLLTRLINRKNFPKHPQKDITLAKIHQLQAINLVILKKYQDALLHLEKSNQFIKSNNEENTILKAENHLNKGIVLLFQKKIDAADKEISAVLNGGIIKNYAFLEAMAKENMSRVRFMQQDYAECINLLHQSQEIAVDFGFQPLQLKIYEGLSNAYIAQNNNQEFEKYRQLFENLKENSDDNKKLATSYLVSVIEDVNQEEQNFVINKTKSLSMYIGFAVFSILVVLVGLLYFLSRNEKDLRKQTVFFESLLERTKKKASAVPEIVAPEIIAEKKTVEEPESKKSSLLSPEKEQELLNRLNAFENTDLYLSNQMSLPFLAAELETNIKYLSEIIKNHKEKKFNAYINDLRIRHIVNLLRTDRAYLNYKVSYLAEISGFSSHSAFTAVFKSITGISPNDFVQQLQHQKVVS